MRSFSLALALFLTAFSGCQCDKELEATLGSLSGVACNDEDGQVLSSASVHVVQESNGKDRVVATNGIGEYRALNLPAGKHTVSVDIGERSRTIGTVTVEPSKDSPVDDTSCSDDPPPPDAGRLVGDICNRHVGTLVAGGEVTVKVGAFTVTGVTDDNGHFEIEDIPEGEGTVTIVAPGFQRTFPIVIAVDETFTIALDDNCNLQTANTGCIIASICDPALGPDSNLVAAEITVNGVGAGAGEATSELTDTLGFFEVCGLVPGQYEVRIKKGSVDATEIVSVTAGETSTAVGPSACEDRVEIGRIEGQVCDEVNGGVFSGRVELRTPGGAVVGAAVLSDADGSFRFENLAPGDYVVTFPDDPGMPNVNVTVVAFQTTPLSARNCPLPEDICTEFIHTPEETSDGRIFFVVDKSGSMLQSAAGFNGDKWTALKSAIGQVTTTLTSDTIDYALVSYPNPANIDCESDQSCVVACNAGTQQVAMGGNGGQVNTALSAITPFGGTPTAQTLANTRATIDTLSRVDRPLAVVLATDGAPNCGTNDGLAAGQTTLRTNCTLTVGSVCTSTADNQTDTNCAPFNCLDLTASDRVRDIAALGVPVHVIGIRGDGAADAAFVNTLNAMAIAGGAALPVGSATRFHDASNTASLQSALAAITRQIVACNITTPFPVNDGARLSLRLGNSPVLQNTSRTNGWDVTGPNNIELFGAACALATASEDAITIERCVAP